MEYLNRPSFAVMFVGLFSLVGTTNTWATDSQKQISKTATTVTTENWALVEPTNYKTQENAFVIPYLDEFFLSIKGGESIYITVDGLDSNTGDFLKGTSPAREASGNIIQLILGDAGNWLVRGQKNGLAIALSLHINYQADVYDRTPGSPTENMRPDVIWVNAGQSATLSGGPSMNINNNNKGYYRWRYMDQSLISQGYNDSIKTNMNPGKYELTTVDGSGIPYKSTTMDTIAILEKPSINNSEKSMTFPSTVAGVIYRIFKSGTDDNGTTNWTELSGLAFTGDGNAHTVSLGATGSYKVGTQISNTANVEMTLPAMVVSVTTDAKVESRDNADAMTQVNGDIYFSKSLSYTIYSIAGKIVSTGNSNQIHLDTPGVYIVKYGTNGKSVKVIVE